MGKKVCDAEAGSCPSLRPALAAAVQYSSICRQSAEWWRPACMHGEGAEWCAGWARYSAGCREGTDCLASPVWFMVGSSAD
jgi:hypothetical protein